MQSIVRHALFGAAGIACLASAMPAQAQMKTFDIPAQDAASGIAALGHQADVQIAASRRATKGKRTHNVAGSMTVENALKMLLSGTGLTAQITGAQTYTIVPLDLPAPERVAAADPNVDSIVVTGRRSVDTPATTIKRAAIGITDSTTATDIEKTPDLNLAEALNRIVGVSSNAFYGTSDAGYVSIRGFDSRYNSIDVDGNPIWFSSQNNRGAQIGQIPTAVVNEVTVYKTPTPEMDGNSVGGHISMRTLRAFDGGTDPSLKAGYRIGFSEQGSRVNGGPSDQAYLSGKFTFGPDHRFGMVFGFNRQRTADYDDFGAISAYSQAKGADGVVRDQIEGNSFTNSAYDKTVRNTAAFAKLETRVEDKLYAFVSGTYFDERREMYLQRAGPYIGAARGVVQTGDGTATFTNGQGQVREYDYEMDRKAKVVGAGLDYRWADRGSIVLRANYTDYSNDIATRNLGSGFRLDGVSGSYDLNGDVPLIGITGPSYYADPTRWTFLNTANSSTSAAYNRTQGLYDKVYTASAVAHFRDQPDARGFGLSAGVGWVRLDRLFNQDADYWALKSGTTLTLSQVVPAGATMAGNAAALNNYDAFWAFMYANGAKRTDLSPTTDYTLREDIKSAHVTVDYALDRLRLLAGFRYEDTSDVTDTGQVVSGVNKPLHRDHDYGAWLPNAQLTFDATQDLKLRAAFTKTIGRADFSDFAPGTTTTVDVNGTTVIKGSNGDLGPRRSTNYDLSAEYYRRDAMIAVALYHKDVTGETFSQVTNVYNAAGMLTEIDTIPLNSGKARVTGIEVSAAKRRLDFLPGPLARLGISGYYTKVWPQWTVIFTDGTRRTVDGLRNHPSWQASVSGTYTWGPAQIVANYVASGRALISVDTTAATDVWQRPTEQLDLQFGLKLYRGLRFTFDAKNVTKAYTIQGTGIDDSIFNAVGKGRSYWLGLRYQL